MTRRRILVACLLGASLGLLLVQLDRLVCEKWGVLCIGRQHAEAPRPTDDLLVVCESALHQAIGVAQAYHDGLKVCLDQRDEARAECTIPIEGDFPTPEHWRPIRGRR